MAYHQPRLPPPTTAKCCCNSSYGCCSPSPPPPPSFLNLIRVQLISIPILTSFFVRINTTSFIPSIACINKNQTHSTIASLLSRIEALERSLNYVSSHGSLRGTAARIIQTHFRAFLVRRSRTLWQLKDLALINSTFNSLKSSFSEEAHIVDFEALSLTKPWICFSNSILFRARIQ